MRIGESIRKLREENGLTQDQLGRIAGVSSMAVSQWENGRAVPRMGSIQMMADYFGVPKSKIMGDEISEKQIRFGITDRLMPDERELLDLYRSLDETSRQMALRAVRGMASVVSQGENQEGEVSAS